VDQPLLLLGLLAVLALVLAITTPKGRRMLTRRYWRRRSRL
jgi:hypothetical protein